MYLKYLLPIFLYLGWSECFKADKLFKDVKSKCETICRESGGNANFKRESELCKCLFNKTVDDTEIKLIQKNAKSLGLKLEIIQSDAEIIAEQNPNKTEITQIEPAYSTGTLNPITTTLSSLELDRNSNFENTTPPSKERLNTLKETHKNLSKIGNEKVIIEQIEEHLNTLSKMHNEESRLFHINAIRANLKQLSHGIISNEKRLKKARITSDRLKTIIKQAKERQQKFRLSVNKSDSLPLKNLSIKLIDLNDASMKDIDLGNENLGKGDLGLLKLTTPKIYTVTQNPTLILN